MPFEYSDPVERAVKHPCAVCIRGAVADLRIVRGQLAAEREALGTGSLDLASIDSRSAVTGADALAWVQGVLRRFHLVVCQLQRRREGRSTLNVTDEYDIQDSCMPSFGFDSTMSVARNRRPVSLREERGSTFSCRKRGSRSR